MLTEGCLQQQTEESTTNEKPLIISALLNPGGLSVCSSELANSVDLRQEDGNFEDWDGHAQG